MTMKDFQSTLVAELPRTSTAIYILNLVATYTAVSYSCSHILQLYRGGSPEGVIWSRGLL